MREKITDITDYELSVDGLKINVLCEAAPKFSNIDQQKSGYFHMHFWYEMFYVTEGEIIFHIKEEEISVKKGQFLLINPNHVHYVENPFCVPVFSFSVKPVSAAFEKHDILNFLRKSSSRIFETDKKCDRLMELLNDCRNEKSSKEAGNYMYALLLHISGLTPDSVLDIAHDSETMRLFKIEYLLNNCSGKDDVSSLEDIAYQINISTRQLSRIMRSKYGCSFKEKVTEIKMLRAIDLLKEGKTVEEAATGVGYASIRAFYTAFTAMYQKTPGEFKKEMQKSAESDYKP